MYIAAIALKGTNGHGRLDMEWLLREVGVVLALTMENIPFWRIFHYTPELCLVGLAWALTCSRSHSMYLTNVAEFLAKVSPGM